MLIYCYLIQAYTFWNVTACGVSFAFRMGWERVLFCNSFAIYTSYRTAGADPWSYKALQVTSGYDGWTYALLDNLVHLLPAVALAYYLVSRKLFVRPQMGAFSCLGQLFFAYAQV